MSYLSLGDKNEEEGDFFGSPVGGSNTRLGSLFGMNAQMAQSTGSNQSLTYTAPKPPRPAKQEAAEKKPQPASTGVGVAVAVTAYRYTNNQYIKQGKLGAALLCNYAERDYKILMYVSKQQPVTTAVISPQFQFNIQPNNYASFYDDQRQMWSVMFDTSENLVKFAKQICLAKYHCGADSNQFASQELGLGEQQTQALEAGDSVEAKYTGWLVDISTGALGSVFDSNHGTEKTFRFKAGKGKVIKGWDQGMLGMKKGGKRFIVIPPSLAYGSKGAGNRVPPNSTLAFEVDILRIKHVKEIPSASTGHDEPSPTPPQPATMTEPTPALPEIANLPASQNDETVKTRTASFNEQLGKVPADKSKLVSRMAKMGHSMFPQAGPAGTHEPDPQQHHVPEPMRPQAPQAYEAKDPTPVHAPVSPAHSQSPFPAEQPYMHNPHMQYQRPLPVHPSAMIPAQSMEAMSHHGMQTQFHPSPSATPFAVNIPAYQHAFNTPQPFPISAGPELLPLILTESREQSSGLKLLLEKVEKVNEKIELIKQSSDSQKIDSAGGTMDTAMLSHTIQRIVQENDKMKTKVLEKDKLIESQSDKIADLLQKNQKHVEDSHLLMEKRNVSFNETFGQTQARAIQLEKEKTDLISKLSESTSKICDLQLKLADATEHANSLENAAKTKSTKAESHAEEEHAKLLEMERKLRDTKSILQKERAKYAELENSLQERVDSATNEAEKRLVVAQENFKKEREKLLQEKSNMAESHQEEIRSLKTKAQGSVADVEDAKRELEVAWKTRCKEAVATVSKAAEKKIAELNDEQEAVKNNLENAHKKYENLRQQATVMKEKYEEKIKELIEKIATSNTPSENEAKGDATVQVKGIMNTVFQQVRSKISSDEEYSGSDVLGIILNIIKSTTLKLLNPDAEESGSEEEYEDEEGEGDGSESEESAGESIEENQDVKNEEVAPQDDATRDQPSEDAKNDPIQGAEEDATKGDDEQSGAGTENPPVTPVSSEGAASNTTGKEEHISESNTENHPEAGETSSTPTIIEPQPSQEHGVTDPLQATVEDKSSNASEDSVPAKEADPIPEEALSATTDVLSPAPEAKDPEKEHSVSPSSDIGSQPPPLFDDEDEESEDDDWLK